MFLGTGVISIAHCRRCSQPRRRSAAHRRAASATAASTGSCSQGSIVARIRATTRSPWSVSASESASIPIASAVIVRHRAKRSPATPRGDPRPNVDRSGRQVPFVGRLRRRREHRTGRGPACDSSPVYGEDRAVREDDPSKLDPLNPAPDRQTRPRVENGQLPIRNFLIVEGREDSRPT